MLLSYTLAHDKTNSHAIPAAHPAYNFERRLLRAIQAGSESEAIVAIQKKHRAGEKKATNDEILAYREILKASLSMYTKAAVDLGLAPNEALRLTEVFRQRIESLTTKKALVTLEYEMALKFLNFVKRARTKKYKFPVSKVVEYIYEHVTDKITLHDLANMVHLSPDYLSRLFMEELGTHITDFVVADKIESAKNLLEFSDMNITEIAALLQFCNAAYFSAVFKKHTNQTPYQYRKAVSA